MKNIFNLLIGFFLLAVTSCTYTFPEAEEPTAGSADFTKVVAVGNSLTAGFMNGALYDDGQANSYATIITQQMGTTFNQPDINSENGYFGTAFEIPGVPDGTTLGRLHLVGLENPAPTPIIPGDAITPYSGDKSALNNFGVPGMRIVDFETVGYGSAAGNPYFNRFASSDGTSVMADAAAANGTFILFWLGSNDALGYATNGATGSADGDGSNPADMTQTAVFDAAYSAAISAMFVNGQKGIIANIPNVQDIPYFTTVPWNSIPMDQATADATNSNPDLQQFNSGIKLYNIGMLPGQDPNNPPSIPRDTIGFKEGQNGIVIYDSLMVDLNAYGIPTMRQATSKDLVTLAAGAVLGTLADPNNPASVIGVGVPLGEKYTLTEANQENIANRIAEFNAIIAAKASSDIALLDINSIFADFAINGASINGAGMDATILPPFGAFSLDGIHPNARGYAYVANLFIDKINESFGSNISNVNPNNYAGNELPVPQ